VVRASHTQDRPGVVGPDLAGAPLGRAAEGRIPRVLRRAAQYDQDLPAFSDALAPVRNELWLRSLISEAYLLVLHRFFLGNQRTYAPLRVGGRAPRSPLT
jgi:hypothetical protein